VTAAGREAFVYALGHAMSVAAAVAVIGAVIGATAIRAKRDELSIEATEAAVSPDGEELAAEQAKLAGGLATR
jgi:hypothetical protein